MAMYPAESKLGKKLNYMIQVFAKDYFVVLIADFVRDQIEIASISEPVVPLLSQTLSKSNTYQDFLDFYSKQYICIQDRAAFEERIALSEIRRRLALSGTYTISAHHLYQERNCPTEITLIDVSDAQDGSECLIAARFIEDIVRQESALKKQDDMVRTLVQDYNAIYHINLDADTFFIMQAHNVVNEDLYDYAYRNLPFQVAMRKFVYGMVREEDREIMMKLSACDYMKERLQKEDGYSYRYQVTPMRGLEYFEMRIVRARTNDAGHYAIMTVRNVDKTAREELRVQREIEKVNKELAQTLKTAESANQTKTEFLSRMSHDIRTPMNAIIGITAIAKATLDDKDKIQDCLDKIDDSSQYLLGIINDILDMSRIESGNMELREQQFMIPDALDDVLEMVRSQSQEKHQTMSVHIKNIRHQQVIGDCGRLQQAFVNILDNAVKYTPDGGHITITVDEKATVGSKVETYIFTFQDNGIGMSPDFLERVFEPFEREEDLRVSKVQGTGLGMAITQNIIHIMGGTIQVESECGKGTCFTVVLPLKFQEMACGMDEQSVLDAAQEVDGGHTHQEDRNANDLKILERNDFSSKRILLVEDNELNRAIMTEIIGATKIAVETAEDGAVAVKMVQTHPDGYYDMILMDIQMPVMNGYDATKAIRTMGPRNVATIPIIAMTANTFEEDVQEALQAGMNEHMAKPISLNGLSKVMNRWLQ